MSDSDLSDAPEYDDDPFQAPISSLESAEPTLPWLPPLPTVLSQSSRVILPLAKSTLYSKNLFRREVLDSHPPQMTILCLQAGCKYRHPSKPVTFNSTSNLWKHLESV